MKSIFVTGTDTGVGKTTVGAALLVAARLRGLRVAASKPVESGCGEGAPGEGRLHAVDAEFLRAAAGGRQPSDEVCPHPLRAPLAPALAAARAGVSLELEGLVAAVRRVAAGRPDLLVVEGAGGLLVPLAGDDLVIDLIARLGYPILLIARAGLGTINHTSMSVEAARRRDLRVAGIVLSDAGPGATEPAAITENVAAIARLTGAPVLGCLPPLPAATIASLDHLAAAAERHLDLDRLLATL